MKTLLLIGVGCLLSASLAMAQQAGRTLEEAVDFGRYEPVGVAISSQGRMFVSFPKWSDDYRYGVVEVKPDGQKQPYPNAEWNRRDTLAAKNHFISVQALFIDGDDRLWVLDPVKPGTKLLRINLKTNAVERTYYFEDLPLDKAALNDVQVDARRQMAYLSDPGRAAIVVLDLKTGKSRSVLERHPSTVADPNFRLVIDGKEVRDNSGKPFASNVNGIALTSDGTYFYYRPITQTHLFRIATKYLINPALTSEQIAAEVEDMGVAGVSHGMIADQEGNVYMGDSHDKVIRRYRPDRRTVEVVVKDERLLWPDSYAISNGYLYVTAAQYHRLPRFNQGQNTVQYPFWLFKVKL